MRVNQYQGGGKKYIVRKGCKCMENRPTGLSFFASSALYGDYPANYGESSYTENHRSMILPEILHIWMVNGL